jgi:hypothetical protein
MTINLIMAEFGRDRTNNGGASITGHRLYPSYECFKEYFPDSKVTVYSDHKDIVIPDDSNIEVKVVNSIFSGQTRYGNRSNDYYKVLGLLESDCDIAISLDSDMFIVNDEVKTLLPLTSKFGMCIPENPRLQVRFDGLKGADGNYSLDEDPTRGNGMITNMSPISFATSNKRARTLLEEYCNQIKINPARGPLCMWRAIWQTGINPYILPFQWCVCGGDNSGTRSCVGINDVIMLHTGHDEVSNYYLSKK